jgi:hypothetical protein
VGIVRFIVSAVVVGAVAAVVSCARGKSAVDDNHPWNAHEAFIFRRHWADEHGGAYRPFQKLTRHDQLEYWNWRHAHPDLHERCCD